MGHLYHFLARPPIIYFDERESCEGQENLAVAIGQLAGMAVIEGTDKVVHSYIEIEVTLTNTSD